MPWQMQACDSQMHIHLLLCVRRHKWKLILGTKVSGGWVEPRDKAPDESVHGQLYDIMEDPYETKDLWNGHPKVAQKLIALLDEYRNSGRSRPLT